VRGRHARTHDERSDARQRCRDGIWQAEGQEIGLRIGAQDAERQHDEACERVRERRRVVGVHVPHRTQLVGHRLCRPGALFGPFGQRTADHAVDGRHSRRSGERRRLLVHRGMEDVHDGAPAERGTARQHLEEDRAGGEQIAARIDAVTRHELGGHVARRPHHHAGSRQPAGQGQHPLDLRACQAEVEQLDAVAREEHVRRLEVAMNDAASVQGGERRQDLQRDRHARRNAQRPAVQPLGERFALQELHGDEQPAFVFADLIDLTDVRMVDARRRTRLSPEPFPRGLIVSERSHGLQRHGALEPLIASGVDDAHAASAKFAEDRVMSETRGRAFASVAGGIRRGRSWGRRARQPVIEGSQPSAECVLGRLVQHGKSIIPPATEWAEAISVTSVR
jgi:hypothetical protein